MQANPNAVSGPRSAHNSEARQTLPVQSYKNDGQALVFDLPLDTAIKRLSIRCYGSFQVTYASGSPVADSAGFNGRLLSRVDVVNQGDTVKTVDPYIMMKQQQLLNKLMPRRAYASSSSAPTSLVASTDASSGAPFAYPATTDYVVINETFTIYFEHPWCTSEAERRKTMLYTRGVSSSQLILQVGSMANLQNYAGGSPVSITYGTVNLSWEVQVVHNPWVIEDPKDPFLYFREITRHNFFSGQTNNGIIDVKTGGLITGFHFLARNGDSNKSLSDIAVTRIRLKVNTSSTVSDFTYRGLQEDNIGRYGADSKLASSSHSLQGYCFLNLMTNGRLATGLDTSRYNTVVLDVDTASNSSGTDQATYTNPVDLEIMTQDVVRPQGK